MELVMGSEEMKLYESYQDSLRVFNSRLKDAGALAHRLSWAYFENPSAGTYEHMFTFQWPYSTSTEVVSVEQKPGQKLGAVADALAAEVVKRMAGRTPYVT